MSKFHEFLVEVVVNQEYGMVLAGGGLAGVAFPAVLQQQLPYAYLNDVELHTHLHPAQVICSTNALLYSLDKLYIACSSCFDFSRMVRQYLG